MKLSKLEKEYLRKLFGSRVDNKKYIIGKTLDNKELFYYCINKKALVKWNREKKLICE